MAESPRRVDLRLTISAAEPFRSIAAEMAEKFAEHAGAANPKSVADGLASSLAEVARTSNGSDILIEMSSQDGGVVINAASETTTKRPNRS